MGSYKNRILEVDPPSYAQPLHVDFEENDYTEIKSVYFAFIDVLGFKKAFDENKLKADSAVGWRYKKVFEYYFSLLKGINFTETDIDNSSLFYAGQTSDSLYFYTESASVLMEILKIFSHFNVYAMSQDVFFRGGIAQGNIFYNERYQFYGDSVINAYLLESEISKNPIIMIDENTYNALAFDEALRNQLIKPEKGRYYIKPFAYLEHKFSLSLSELTRIEDVDPNILKEIIRKNKSKFEYDSRNYGKYLFLIEEFEKCEKNILE